MQYCTPRIWTGLSTLGCLLLLPALHFSTQASDEDGPPTVKEINDAGELFRSSCSACHLPPDPGHALDLAWLRQVTDTA